MYGHKISQSKQRAKVILLHPIALKATQYYSYNTCNIKAFQNLIKRLTLHTFEMNFMTRVT